MSAQPYQRHLHTRVDPRTGSPVWPLRIVENRLTPAASDAPPRQARDAAIEAGASLTDGGR